MHYGDGDPLTAPATPDAETWQGWGTALKPAHEPIVMARKPLVGTVAGNVLAHGTGALNVDGCRIEHDERSAAWVAKWSGHDGHPDDSPTHGKGIGNRFGGSPSGRWPANVLLDPEAAPMLDEQSGNRPGMATQRDMQHTPSAYFGADKYPGVREGFNDSGGASRFFYCAKASSGERNAGLDGFEARGAVTGINPTRPVCNVCGCGTVVPGPGKTMRCGHTDIRFEDARPVQQRNSHPTVKPINLMRWLVRLVTPPGGTVLDPFTGSGTTGCAAVLEGFEFVGIERDPEYAPIARARIEWWEQHPDGMALVERLTAERARAAVTDSGQLDLLSFVDPSPGGTGQ